jgi:hypothetical protein
MVALLSWLREIPAISITPLTIPTGLAVTAVDANNATDAALITNVLSFILFSLLCFI